MAYVVSANMDMKVPDYMLEAAISKIFASVSVFDSQREMSPQGGVRASMACQCRAHAAPLLSSSRCQGFATSVSHWKGKACCRDKLFSPLWWHCIPGIAPAGTPPEASTLEPESSSLPDCDRPLLLPAGGLFLFHPSPGRSLRPKPPSSHCALTAGHGQCKGRLLRQV